MKRMIKEMMFGKRFWKSYIGNYPMLITKIIVILFGVGIYMIMMRSNPLPFVMGVILADPFNYYILFYNPEEET